LERGSDGDLGITREGLGVKKKERIWGVERMGKAKRVKGMKKEGGLWGWADK